MPRVVVAALCREPGEVLLCHRSPNRRWYPDVWDFPGGHVESGETPLDALQREIIEEVSVTVDIACLAEKPDLQLQQGDLQLSVWLVRKWAGEPVNAAPDEHDRLEWFAFDRAGTATLAHPVYRDWLARLGDREGPLSQSG